MASDREPRRPAALVTGAGRLEGIAAGIAARLADDGWDLALSYWRPYDANRPWASGDDDGAWTTGQLIHTDGGFSS